MLTGYHLWNWKAFNNSAKRFLFVHTVLSAVSHCYHVHCTTTAIDRYWWWPWHDPLPASAAAQLSISPHPQGVTIMICQQTEMAGRWAAHSHVCPHQCCTVPQHLIHWRPLTLGKLSRLHQWLETGKLSHGRSVTESRFPADRLMDDGGRTASMMSQTETGQ